VFFVVNRESCAADRDRAAALIGSPDVNHFFVTKAEAAGTARKTDRREDAKDNEPAQHDWLCNLESLFP
jgi:hypothetical protein